MPKTKSSRVARTAKRPQRFSLVPPAAQQAMYAAVRKLSAGTSASDSGAEVAEIAVALACGDEHALIFASTARGARTLGRSAQPCSTKSNRLSAATVAAVDELLKIAVRDEGASAAGAKSSRKSARRGAPAPTVAVVCAGRLDDESPQDYRAAFAFAARHKLPILYVVSNRLTRDKAALPDLRSLYAEFGMPLFTVDAADAIAAYRVATEALHNARQMRGPCVIEAIMLPNHESPLELLSAYMIRHGVEPDE